MCLHFSHTFFLLCWLDGFHPCTRPLAWLLLQLLAQKPWTGWLPGLPASPRVSGHIPPAAIHLLLRAATMPPALGVSSRPGCPTPTNRCATHNLDLGHTLLCIHMCSQLCVHTSVHKKNKTPACKGNDEDAKSLYKGYIHSVMKNWACKGNMCWKHKSKRHCKHTLHLFSSHEQG